MTEMIAFCGIVCNMCPTFLATQANDDEKRAEVATLWSKQFKMDLKPGDMNCDGCHSHGGVLFGHCMTCEIRKCGAEKEIANCAYCSESACEKLDRFFAFMPDAKTQLDNIRIKL